MKKHILFLLTALTLLAALFPAAVSAAGTTDADAELLSANAASNGGYYGLDTVNAHGNSVDVEALASKAGALFVGLYDKDGKMTAARSVEITPSAQYQNLTVTFDADIGAGLYAKAFLLDAETCAPLCAPEDSFRAEQYALIEGIAIEGANNQLLTSSLPYSRIPSSGVQAVLRTADGAKKTVALDDSKNYRNADGLNVANAFRPGRIVRLTKNDDVYHLSALDATSTLAVYDFTISGENISSNGETIRTPAYTDDNGNAAGGNRLFVDSRTHFVVQDVENDICKSYIGVEKVPDVTGPENDRYHSGATAYVYHVGGRAQMVFIMGSMVTRVYYPAAEPTFLIAPSVSPLIRSQGNNYYYVKAVHQGEITTLKIRRDVAFSETGSYFVPGSAIANMTDAGNCVILNKIIYDSNDLVIQGLFDTNKSTWGRAIGISRSASPEVRLNTFNADESYPLNVAENVRVFYYDGEEAKQINYDDIPNDANDAVYYVLDDERNITHLFIVSYDGDGSPRAAMKPIPSYAFNMGDVDSGYTVAVTGGLTEAKAGEDFQFQILDDNTAMPNTALTSVYLQYVDMDGNKVTIVPAYDAETYVWTAHMPGADMIREDSEIFFIVM